MKLPSMPYAPLGALAMLLAGLLTWNDGYAQRHPGEIPKPGTYEGSVELQRLQQEAERQRQSGAPPAGRSTAPSTASAGDAQAAAQAAYAAWDAKPALPAERNPLLGRWSWQSAGTVGQGMSALFDGSMANAMGCSLLFGDGAVEFRAATIVNVRQGRETQVGTVAYRGGGRQVIALQRDGPRLFLMFDFVTPDRISLADVPCVMNRIGTAAASAAATSSAPAQTRAAPQAASASSRAAHGR